MESFNESMIEYRSQLKKGVINRAYKGLMEYILELRTHFQNRCPDYSVPGSIYFGYMDMTYFSVLPQPLKDRKLKIAIVFLHEAFRFEVWLAAVNKQVQTQYWKLFKESGWNQYRLVSTLQGADSILESVLVDNPDFTDLVALTHQIEVGALKFIADIEDFLAPIKTEGD